MTEKLNPKSSWDNGETENIVVGRNPVLELLKNGKEIEKIFLQRGEREGSISLIFSEAKKRGIVILEADKRKLDQMSAGNAHQGVAAIVAQKEYVSVAEMVAAAEAKGEKPLIVVCDDVEDPHNIGAIIRSAECAGAHGLIIGKRHAPVIGQTVYKSSAGAAELLPIAKVSNIAAAIEELKKLGVWVYAADMDGSPYTKTDWNGPCALVLGSEGNGVSRLVKEKCDFCVSIPMYGHINSLNVSAAASVLLFAAAESRHSR